MSVNKEKIDSIFGALDKDMCVGILVQNPPDPDCLGAAAGFSALLKHVYELESKVYHYGEISHPQNKSMKNILHIALEDGTDFDPDAVSATVVLDTDLTATGFKSKKFDKVNIRIDHHTMDRDKHPDVSDIRSVGSTCSIVWDYLKEFEVPMEEYSDAATAMVIGIQTDTANFTSHNTCELDIQAFAELLLFVNKEALARVNKFPLPKQLFEIESLAYDRKSIKNTALVSFIGKISHHDRDIIATIADRFSRMDGINTVVIMAIIDSDLIASVRSVDSRVDVSAFCAKVFEKKYSGAKEGAGGAKFPLGAGFGFIGDNDIKENAMKEIITSFEEKIFDALGEK